MKQKIIVFATAVVFLLSAMLVAAQGDPVESYFTGKLLPFVQSTATIVAVLYLIFGGLKFLKSDDPAEKDRGIKVIIGVAIAVALIWLAPAIIEFLKPT